MLRISNLSLARGIKLLLDDASLTVHPGHKVGLIGANGSGKTTLFALLRGEVSQDKGELSMPPGWVIAHVAQEAAPAATSAIDYVLDGDRELRAPERAPPRCFRDWASPPRSTTASCRRSRAVGGCGSISRRR